MNGKWRWLLYLIVIWQFVRTSISAFSISWRWTADQCLFVLFIAAVVFGVVPWLIAWLRGGASGVSRHRAILKERWAKPVNLKVFRWSLLFWVAVALMLVAIFNFMPH